ncbi:MAG: hypothetical protein IJQ81_02760 [Oscillibacter sp.]|nr:hypothetical protein [Oscillibacter sp.]
MKIVFSRKGFDSAYGGYPSIICENGKMQSFPIPNSLDSIKYSDVYCKATDTTLYDTMKAIRSKIRNKTWIDLTEDSTCHLDPDIDYYAIPRKEGWTGCFGQGSTAQSVLRNASIGDGDLFLFFGWFNSISYKNGLTLKFSKGDGFHAFYGYMQVDKMLYTTVDTIPTWLQYHPHADERHLKKANNCIYVAKEFCTWNNQRRGYGVFDFDEQLMLTKKGFSKSKWNLPAIFRDVDITYHTQKSWKDEYFQAAHRGQEFVINANEAVREWAIELIENNARRQ